MEDKESIEELLELAKALAEMKQECLESDNQFKVENESVLLEADTKDIGTIKSEPFAIEKLAVAKEDPFLSPKQRLVSCSFCEKPFSRLDQWREGSRESPHWRKTIRVLKMCEAILNKSRIKIA